ncbi:MAG: hypothetical protein ACLFO1_05110 [Spirochaetaceae bacterium]
MNRTYPRQRPFAALMVLGAGVLLFRTVKMMLVEGAFTRLVWWVAALTVVESLIDLACLAASARWLVTGERAHSRSALRLGAAAAIFHALRVLIYVLGRIGPWHNFDVRPELRPADTSNTFWVYFAAILAVLGVMGVEVFTEHTPRSRVMTGVLAQADAAVDSLRRALLAVLCQWRAS